jgi:endonuclease YncB( thermonuclease family)
MGLISIVVAVIVATSASQSSASSAISDRDCDDFRTQYEAQRWFDRHGPGDPAGLDADGNGIACESLRCPCSAGDQHEPEGPHRFARVVEVTDGDTIEVRIGGRTTDVRLIGINTPQVYGGTECGGREASAAMRELLQPGDHVTLIRDRSQPRRDRHGRLLRYVERNGNVDVGRSQIRDGWTKAYVVGSPFARVHGYSGVERFARLTRAGAWQLCGGHFHHPL